MLTIDQMNQITKEVTLGMEPTLMTEAAKLFRVQVIKEVEALKAKGQVVELPGE